MPLAAKEEGLGLDLGIAGRFSSVPLSTYESEEKISKYLSRLKFVFSPIPSNQLNDKFSRKPPNEETERCW